MRKKILLVLGILILASTMASCSPFSTSYDYGNAEVVEVKSNLRDVIGKVEKSCVGIQTRLFSKSSLSASIGSGVVYKQAGNDYYCVTNFHVVSDSLNKAQDTSSYDITYKVFLGSNNYAVDAYYVCGSYQKDLAVLRFTCKDQSKVASLELKSIDNVILTPGSIAISIGCPLDLIYFNTVSVGNIAKEPYLVNNNGGSLKIVQHNCGINPGNSGGGLFDANGNLIGVNFKKTNSIEQNGQIIYVEGLNYAIYIDEVMTFLSSNGVL